MNREHVLTFQCAQCLAGEDVAMDGPLSYLVGAARASSTLEFAGITGAKAEGLLAAIWCILEAHSLGTPTIEIDSANGLFDISLTFGSADDHALIEKGLPYNTPLRP